MRFLLIGGLCLLLVQPVHAADIEIGVAGPLTGPMASTGQRMKEGATLAVEAINAKGGVLRQHLSLLVQDDACDPQKAKAVATAMRDEHVALVVGHGCSTASLAAAEIYDQNRMLAIDVGASSLRLTQGGSPARFRLNATTKAIAVAIGRYTMAANPEARIAIVTDQEDVPKELTVALQNFFAVANGRVVDNEHVFPGITDFSGLLDKMVLSAPDVILCACYANEAGNIARAIAAKKWDVYFYGWNRLASPEFLKALGGAPSKKIVAIDDAPPPASDAYQAIIAAAAKHNWPVNRTTLLAYTAVEIFADAALKVQSVDARKLAKDLHSERFSSVIGGVEFNELGDRTDPRFSTYSWIGGRLVSSNTLSQ